MKQVSLTRGLFALVDDEDFELVSKHTWRAAIKRPNVYATTGWKETEVAMHRLILGLKKYDPRCVDHINGNGLDNRKENLRVCTPNQNNFNMSKRSAMTSSQYKGVYKHKTGKWHAQVRCQGKRYSAGYYTTEDEAALAYNVKALELHGEFARLNVVTTYPRH